MGKESVNGQVVCITGDQLQDGDEILGMKIEEGVWYLLVRRRV